LSYIFENKNANGKSYQLSSDRENGAVSFSIVDEPDLKRNND
jgi:hypothetical protein